jgi:hydroxylaminobenzene mutase
LSETVAALERFDWMTVREEGRAKEAAEHLRTTAARVQTLSALSTVMVLPTQMALRALAEPPSGGGPSQVAKPRGMAHMEETKRRLLWYGMLLFLFGLLTGFVEQQFANPRMGLAAHLEGVMNGTFLIALGAIWTNVRLSPRLEAAAYWSALYGTYVNWAVTTLAAVFGTAAMSPITGLGHTGQPWQEGVVTAGFTSVGIAIVVSALLVLWGLRRGAPPRSSA